MNHLNADVRWTSARCGLDRIDTMISLFAEKRNATNLAGTCLDDGYLKCTLITNKKRLVSTSRFFVWRNSADRFEPLNAIVQWTIARRVRAPATP